jgi:single-strand DNA-binding protein
MARYNKSIMIGHLVADPELKQTQNGVSVTSFRIGVSRKRINQNEAPKSDFFNIVAWRSTAEFIARNFRKGDPILVTGEMQNRDYTDQSGNKRYVTELIAEEAEFVERKNGGQEEAPAYAAPGNAAPAYASPAYATPNFENVTDESELPF